MGDWVPSIDLDVLAYCKLQSKATHHASGGDYRMLGKLGSPGVAAPRDGSMTHMDLLCVASFSFVKVQVQYALFFIGNAYSRDPLAWHAHRTRRPMRATFLPGHLIRSARPHARWRPRSHATGVRNTAGDGEDVAPLW
jgi:hypothetical protein